MNYTIISGSTVRFYTSSPFTSVGGTVINPDVVTFKYSVQGMSEVTHTWTNPTGDPTSTIVNTATGYFQADISTTELPGVWTWQWAGFPSSGTDTTNTAVIAEGTITVSQASL